MIACSSDVTENDTVDENNCFHERTDFSILA